MLVRKEYFMLEETTNGNPICEICGNSGDMLPMLLYSNKVKASWEPASDKEDHHVCSDCSQMGYAREYGWFFIR